MPDLAVVGLVALGILVLNVPFGYCRAGLRRFSPLWFVAIHAPTRRHHLGVESGPVNDRGRG